jgi:hypothetical protein
VALDLMLILLVAVESAGWLRAEPTFEERRPALGSALVCRHSVEHRGAEQTLGGPAFPTTAEAVMRYRVTWNVEVDADDEGRPVRRPASSLLEERGRGPQQGRCP